MKTTRFIAILALIALVVLPISAKGKKEEAAPADVPAAAVVQTEVKPTAAAVADGHYIDIDSADIISQFNYAYGYEVTLGFMEQGVDFVGPYYFRGIIDGFDAMYVEALLSPEEMNAAISKYNDEYYGTAAKEGPGSIISLDDVLRLEAPKTDIEKFSYSYGFIYIFQMVFANGLDIYPIDFMQGASDVLFEKTPLFDYDKRGEIIQAYADDWEARMNAYADTEELAAHNLEVAEAFLAENKDAEGFTAIGDGMVLLQVVNEDEVLGATPAATDTVIVDYTLYLPDGSVMDQGKGVSFNLQSLIPGFTLACTNMKVGQEAFAYIHPDYGYGPYGAGTIEPNSLLIFDIYLKGIEQ